MSDDVFSCSCPQCDASIEVTLEQNGQETECSSCSATFVIELPLDAVAADLADQDTAHAPIEDSAADPELDMSDGPTRVEDEEVDLDLTEEELVDLSESDTKALEKSSCGVIDLSDLTDSDTKNLKKVADDDMTSSTVKIQRKNVGMIPDYKEGDGFDPIESTQSISVNADKIQSRKKKWWQIW